MALVQIDRPDPTLEADARELRSSLAELLRVYSFRDRDRICCYDVSVTQSHALDALVLGGAMTLNQLAAELYLDKSTTSRVVDGLVRKGYAEREPNPKSRRSVLVRVTPAGEALRERIERDLLDSEKRLLADFDPEVRQAMTRLIARLTRAAAARVDTSGGTCCEVA